MSDCIIIICECGMYFLYLQSKIAHIHPLYAVLPMVVSSNFAYMMPTATAVGAIVFATGKVRLLDMVGTCSLLLFRFCENLIRFSFFSIKGNQCSVTVKSKFD